MIPESVAGVVFSDNRTQVLLIKRRDVPVWVLPGGGIEANEPPETAIVREILEETGFRVKVVRASGFYLPINRLARQTILYECAIESGAPSLSSETRSIRFFPYSALPLMPPPYLEWIEEAHAALEPAPIKTLHSLTYRTFLKLLFFHPILVFRFLLARLGFPINSG